MANHDVVRSAAEADKACFSRFLHTSNPSRFIGNLGRIIPAVQMQNVHVIRAKNIKARFVFYNRILARAGLCGNNYLVPLPSFDNAGKDFSLSP